MIPSFNMCCSYQTIIILLLPNRNLDYLMGIKFQDINDPCDCGSGLKTKDCHLKPSLPNEFFTVRVTKPSEDYFEEFVNGQWRRIPGRVMMNVSCSNQVYEDIIKLLEPLRKVEHIEPIRLERFATIVHELNLDTNHDATISWNNRINKLQHKLSSLKYHMEIYTEHEKNFQEKCKREYTDSIVELEEVDPVYYNETESFLFQTKSILDILSQIIGIAFKLTGVVTYANDGDDLIDKLGKTASYRDKPIKKKEMISIIDRNKNWVKDLVNMRDLITHFSDIIGFKSIIHSPTSNDNEFANIYYPSMPNKERVTTFMNHTWTKLVQLIRDVNKKIVELYA
jgi:hypothetical protein